VTSYLRGKPLATGSISWAVKAGTTTKIGIIPGGLGLSLICEFLECNQGGIQIVSHDEYWVQEGKRARESNIGRIFPGTMVNLEFNINDALCYSVPYEELEDEDIF